MIAEEDDSDCLGPSEAEAAINAISDGDWKRLRSHSRLMSLGIPEMVDDDLMHEALVRLLEGKRRWRRGVEGFTTMYNIMRSIASDTRKKAREGPIARFTVVTEGNGGDDEEEVPQQEAAAIAAGTPELALEIKKIFAILEKLIVGNEDEEGVLQCWACGLFGQQAADELQISMKAYDAARKRLDRKIATAKKEGQ